MRLKSSVVCFLAVIVSILNNAGYVEANEENVENYVTSDAYSVSNFIEENFAEFVREASVDLEEEWKATYIEDKFPIEVKYLDEVTEGMFLDFDGDNGYAVISTNYTFRDFETTGESPYKVKGVESSRYVYNVLSGYYYEVDGELKNVIDEYDEECINNRYEPAGALYNGQEELEASKFGGIVSCAEYMSDKYKKTYTPVKTKSLNMKCYTQLELSAYKKWYKSGNSFGYREESNCALVSAFNLLQYMRGFNMIRMPSPNTTVRFNATYYEPRSYYNYYNGSGQQIGPKVYSNGKSKYQFELKTNVYFPQLYCDIRQTCDQLTGKFDKQILDTTIDVIDAVCRKYGYVVDIGFHPFYYSYVDTALHLLDCGWPLLWSFKGHITAVKGYRLYEYTRDLGVYKSTYTYVLLELADGYADYPRFFNLTGYRDNAGIGTFVCVCV